MLSAIVLVSLLTHWSAAPSIPHSGPLSGFRSAAVTHQQPPAGQIPAVAPPQAATGSGRVVVTISTEGLRIPAVNVGLRNLDGNVVLAQTLSDVVGQAAFPDVPPGRYVIRAVRE